MPVYTVSVLASVFAAFLLAGYHTNAARFVQLQYGHDYRHAWFYTFGQCADFFYRATLYTHPFNGPLSGTTRVSRYQNGKTSLDFAGATDSEWQWHQLGRMQVCTSIQTDNHASTPPLSFYRPDALPAAQPTASKH